MKSFHAILWLSLLITLPGFGDDDDVSNWYRGNTHAHSLWSDGNDFAEMIVDWYHRNGYDFVALSDHDILAEGEKMISVSKILSRQKKLGHGAILKCEARFGNDWLERRTVKDQEMIVLKTLEQFRGEFEQPGKFYIMTAEEISNVSKSGGVHINALNVTTKIPSIRDRKMEAREVMRRCLQLVKDQAEKNGQSIITHLNHPNFQWAITAQDLASVTEEHFFEVYNGHPGINHLGKEGVPGDEQIWDIANTIRLGEMDAHPLFGVATDDSHTYHGGNVSPGRGWIMVGAKELNGAGIVNAMKVGDFYASSGVFLKTLSYDNDTRSLSFEIAKDGEATFSTQMIGTRKGDANEVEIGEVFATIDGTKVSYKLPEGILYLRATVTSSQAHRNPSFKDQKKQAWLQPVGWR